MLDRLQEYEATDITIEPSSFNDPFYILGFEGKSVYPRPGAPVDMNFPVHLAGEIDGTVRRPGVNGTQPASSLHVQLVNMRGDVALSTLTAFDGYFVISLIPPGEYLLMIAPSDLKGSGTRQPWPQRLSIGYDGKVLSGHNVMLEPGTDVPIAFYKQPKTKNTAADLINPPPKQIELGLGQYRSALLAQVVRLRIHSILQRAGITAPPIENKSAKGGEALIATLDPTQLDQARQVCAALVVNKLACTMTVSPEFLLAAPKPSTLTPSLALADDER